MNNFVIKNKTKNLFSMIVVFALFFSLFSCAPKKFIVEKGESKSLKPLKKIALIQVIITPPNHPSKYGSPITNSICKSRTNKIAESLIKLHEDRIDGYTELMGQKLKEYSNMEVLYGESLINLDYYHHLIDNGIKIFPPVLNNKHFPEAILQENSYNFFDFSHVSTPYGFFSENQDYTKIIEKNMQRTKG